MGFQATPTVDYKSSIGYIPTQKQTDYLFAADFGARLLTKSSFRVIGVWKPMTHL